LQYLNHAHSEPSLGAFRKDATPASGSTLQLQGSSKEIAKGSKKISCVQSGAFQAFVEADLAAQRKKVRAPLRAWGNAVWNTWNCNDYD
jgi:hypothetical protein